MDKAKDQEGDNIRPSYHRQKGIYQSARKLIHKMVPLSSSIYKVHQKLLMAGFQDCPGHGPAPTEVNGSLSIDINVNWIKLLMRTLHNCLQNHRENLLASAQNRLTCPSQGEEN